MFYLKQNCQVPSTLCLREEIFFFPKEQEPRVIFWPIFSSFSRIYVYVGILPSQGSQHQSSLFPVQRAVTVETCQGFRAERKRSRRDQAGAEKPLAWDSDPGTHSQTCAFLL